MGDEPALAEREWVERIGAAARWGGQVLAAPVSSLPDHLKQPFDWRYDLWTNTARIRLELGYVEPVALDEALRRTVDWELAQLEGAASLDCRGEDA